MPESNITKNALAAALKKCMNRTAFSKISISAICSECGMNRKSFHYHFKDKYDLVNWIFYDDFIKYINIKDYTDSWDFLRTICQHFIKDAIEDIEHQIFFNTFFCDALLIALTHWLSSDQIVAPNDYIEKLKTVLLSVAEKTTSETT